MDKDKSHTHNILSVLFYFPSGQRNGKVKGNQHYFFFFLSNVWDFFFPQSLDIPVLKMLVYLILTI